MASIVHAIGKAHPGRRRRYKKIRADHPELWQRIVKKGIVEEWTGPAERDHAFDASEEMTDENAPSRDGCNLEVGVNSRCRGLLGSCGEFISCQFVRFGV